jgi:transposase
LHITLRGYLRGWSLPGHQRDAQPSKLDPFKHCIEERAKVAPDWIQAAMLLRN